MAAPAALFSSDLASAALMGNCSENRRRSGAGALTGLARTKQRHGAPACSGKIMSLTRLQPALPIPMYIGIGIAAKRVARLPRGFLYITRTAKAVL